VPPVTGTETLATLPQVYLNTQMPAAPAVGGTVISVSTTAQSRLSGAPEPERIPRPGRPLSR